MLQQQWRASLAWSSVVLFQTYDCNSRTGGPTCLCARPFVPGTSIKSTVWSCWTWSLERRLSTITHGFNFARAANILSHCVASTRQVVRNRNSLCKSFAKENLRINHCILLPPTPTPIYFQCIYTSIPSGKSVSTGWSTTSFFLVRRGRFLPWDCLSRSSRNIVACGKVNTSPCIVHVYNSAYRGTPPARPFDDDVFAVTLFVRHVLRLKQLVAVRVHAFVRVRFVCDFSQLEFLQWQSKLLMCCARHETVPLSRAAPVFLVADTQLSSPGFGGIPASCLRSGYSAKSGELHPSWQQEEIPIVWLPGQNGGASSRSCCGDYSPPHSCHKRDLRWSLDPYMSGVGPPK